MKELKMLGQQYGLELIKTTKYNCTSSIYI